VIWAGLGGDPSYPLYQAGSGAFCQNGAAVHLLWYEVMTPADQSPIVKVRRISAGDTVDAEVTLGDGASASDIHLADLTTGWSADFPFTAPSPFPTTAEWIAEAPSVNGQVSTLADFAPLTFHGCSADLGSESLATWPTRQLTEMVLHDGGAVATPGAISSDPAGGGQFTVTYSP